MAFLLTGEMVTTGFQNSENGEISSGLSWLPPDLLTDPFHQCSVLGAQLLGTLKLAPSRPVFGGLVPLLRAFVFSTTRKTLSPTHPFILLVDPSRPFLPSLCPIPPPIYRHSLQGWVGATPQQLTLLLAPSRACDI